MLMIVSNLYEETVHIKKTLKTTEKVTNDSYQLYLEMKGKDVQLSGRILRLAGGQPADIRRAFKTDFE